MKKLTLSETWKQCLRMWKWIDENYPKKPGFDKLDLIIDLKNEWLDKNGIEDELNSDCFFCEYAERRWNEEVEQYLNISWNREICYYCPGKLVDKEFSCTSVSYNYTEKPHKFYQKLLSLNKKRKDKK